MLALVVDGALVEVRGPRPSGEIKLSDGSLIRPGEQGWTPELLEACGFAQMNVISPPVGPDEVYDTFSDAMVDGVPTRTWTVRTKTAEELQAEAVAAAADLERQQARQAIQNLRSYIQLTNPTAAQTRQAVEFLCRVAIRLIRDQYGD